jgi:hypothetical protein
VVTRTWLSAFPEIAPSPVLHARTPIHDTIPRSKTSAEQLRHPHHGD